jgi:hypothetical protein
MNSLKLFVWTNFAPDYSGGLAFAIAENEEEAKQLVKESADLKDVDWWPEDWGKLQVMDIKKIAFQVTGGA